MVEWYVRDISLHTCSFTHLIPLIGRTPAPVSMSRLASSAWVNLVDFTVIFLFGFIQLFAHHWLRTDARKTARLEHERDVESNEHSDLYCIKYL